MATEVVATLILVLTAGVLALRHGGAPERMAVAIIPGWFLADIGYHLLFGPSGFNTVDPVHLVLDGAELVAIFWLAMNANRMWPLWAAAAQVICYSGHLAAIIEPGGMTMAYWVMTQIPPYVQLIALLLGVAAHTRRERRVGPYRSWRIA